MSSGSIDERIVEMTFKGQTLIEGAKNSVAALRALSESLNKLKGGEQGLNSIESAGKKFSLSGLANGIQQASSHFDLLKFAGITALGTIVSRATSAGISLVKSLTIDPIKAGLDVYETKINAIQTILANTSAEGTKLSDVTSALNQLNTYANQTVYNFGQMAQNIGTFTAAGVNLKTSVASIKGIANLAALSGSSAEQASTAMYQLSQAIAAGSVKLQDWNSVVNAGLGGKVFQNALIQTAKATGVNIDAIIKKAGSFRNSLQQGWLTSKILTQTLSTFTGDLTAQQLKSMGYSQQQVKLIMEQATAAKNSATQIRTITQLQAALREEVATAWSTVWQSLIGNIGDATSLLTSVHNTLETLFTKPVYDLNKFLGQWVKLGGRDQVIQAISESFRILGKVLSTIGSAFREVFPPVTAQTLIAAGVALDNFITRLEPSKKSLAELKQVFIGIFSVIKIVSDVSTKLVLGLLGVGATAISSGSGVLSLAAKLGVALDKFQKMITSSDGIHKFFVALDKGIQEGVKSIEHFIGSIHLVTPSFTKMESSAQSAINKVSGVFSKLGSAIAHAVTSGDVASVIGVINGALLSSVLLSIRNFFSKFGEAAKKGNSGGLLSSIKESIEALTGSLKSMQTELKARALEEIAIAIGILTVSMFALSGLNVRDLTRSLSAITVMLTQLISALGVVTIVAGSTGIVKMAVIGAALIELATAINVLAVAVLILGHMSWSTLEKGIGSIAALLLVLIGATKLMTVNAKGLVASAYSLEVMAIALNILSHAVVRLGSQSLSSLEKGVGSIAAVLILLTAFQHLSSGENLIATAAAMLLIGAAMNVMAIAIESLGKQSISSLVKGITSLAAVLLILIVAMNTMSGSIAGAAALVIAASSILILARALNSLGGISWIGIAKALIVLASALVLLAAASISMEASLPGAAALLVMAAALAILTPILVTFSKFSWEGIAKALIVLAGAFVVLGAAGVVLAPLAAVLLIVGAAIALIGVGFIAAGAGITIFAAGVALLAASFSILAVAVSTFITTILNLLPNAIGQVTKIIVAVAEGVTKAGPAILGAITAVLVALLGAIAAVIPRATVVFGQVLDAILRTIIKYAPRLINTFYTLVLDLLGAITKYEPRFVTTGVTLIVNLLNGVARQIPRVAAAAVNIIVAFINAIGAGQLKIVAAGINMIINFTNGLANEIRKDTPRMNAAGANLASAIIAGMASGIFGGIGIIISAARTVASSALAAAKSALGINSPSKKFEELYYGTGEGAVVGIQKSSGIVANAAANMSFKAVDSTKKGLAGLSDLLAKGIDATPTITPVLDLTKAREGFDQLSAMSKSHLISATTTSSTASSISAQNAAAAEAAGIAGGGNTLNYTQNNYSPVALDATTIYRQTKNQLSVTKGALASANSG